MPRASRVNGVEDGHGRHHRASHVER
jgi:hypothetical protein